MLIAEFETVSPPLSQAADPIRLEQRGAALGASVVAALLICLALLLFIPFVALATHFAANPDARTALAAHPGAALQIALGLALASVLIGWPLRALINRLGRRRCVVIEAGEVNVSDTGLWRQRGFQKPLRSYLGLAHHVRTTHSGTRHELILVHPDRRFHVLVALADRMTDLEVATAASRLEVAVVPASLIYRRHTLVQPAGVQVPVPEPACTSAAAANLAPRLAA